MTIIQAKKTLEKEFDQATDEEIQSIIDFLTRIARIELSLNQSMPEESIIQSTV